MMTRIEVKPWMAGRCSMKSIEMEFPVFPESEVASIVCLVCDGVLECMQVCARFAEHLHAGSEVGATTYSHHTKSMVCFV